MKNACQAFLLYIFSLILPTQSLIAQNPDIEVIKSNITDLLGYDVWQKVKLQNENEDSLLHQYSKLALSIAKTTNKPEKIGDAYYNFGKMKEYLEYTYDSMQINFEKALYQYSLVGKSKKIAKAHTSLGYVYLNKLRMREAQNHLLKALELFKENGNKRDAHKVFRLLAQLNSANENHLSAVAYYKEAYDLSELMRDTAELIRISWTSLGSYVKLDQFDVALARADKCLELIHAYYKEETFNLREVYYGRGEVYLEMNRIDDAWEDYKRAYELALADGSSYAPFYTDGMAYILQLKGNFEEAIKLHKMRIDMMNSVGEYENLHTSHFRLAKCYEAKKEYPKAIFHNEKGWKILDSLMHQRNEALLQTLEEKNQIQTQASTIQSQKTQLQQQRQIQWLSIGSTTLLTLLLMGLFFTYRRNKKTNFLLQSLNTGLSEKNQQNELLLKEIHHRVKNNLETVSSLLELQSAQVEDDEVQSVMLASQNRVQSMSIIHQKLYQGENLASIEMKDYFKNLAESVLDTYDAWEQVEIEYDMPKVELDVDTAIPIGLIVNELLTNSLKYAFPDEKKGKITLGLKPLENKKLQLVVADNGVGKSTTATPKGTGFGAQLVNLLTRQLNGTMKEEQVDGMHYIFEFKNSTWH